MQLLLITIGLISLYVDNGQHKSMPTPWSFLPAVMGDEEFLVVEAGNYLKNTVMSAMIAWWSLFSKWWLSQWGCMFGAREGRDQKGKWIYWQRGHKNARCRQLCINEESLPLGCIWDFLRSLNLSQGRIWILGWIDPVLSQSGELGGISRCFCLIVCDSLRYK